jgi:GDSL-like Lipase/Acylhydrolase family
MRWLVPLASIVVSALVAVAGFEVLLRLTDYSAPIWYQPDERLGWRLRPGVEGLFTAEGRAQIEVSAAGLRDREHAREKPEGVYRIAVLGDSYSEAMQVPLARTYWAQLPERLAACGFAGERQVDVLNFGVSGYGTAQQYLMLESVALGYRPDLVLLQFTNGNDVRNNSIALEEERHRPFFVYDEHGALVLNDAFRALPGQEKRSSLAWSVLRSASDHSRVLQLVRAATQVQILSSAHAKEGKGVAGLEAGLEAEALLPPRDRDWQDAWRVTEGLIARTRDLAEQNGAKLLLVTVPYAVQVHPDRELREALRAKLGVEDLFYPDRRLAAFAKRQGIPAAILAPAMQKLAESRGEALHGFANAQPGLGHWNERGHRAAADLIAMKLCGAEIGAVARKN